MPTLLTFRQAAERLNTWPRVLSDAFYDGVLTDDHCVYVGQRRTIPDTLLEKIANVLRRSGRLRESIMSIQSVALDRDRVCSAFGQVCTLPEQEV